MLSLDFLSLTGLGCVYTAFTVHLRAFLSSVSCHRLLPCICQTWKWSCETTLRQPQLLLSSCLSLGCLRPEAGSTLRMASPSHFLGLVLIEQDPSSALRSAAEVIQANPWSLQITWSGSHVPGNRSGLYCGPTGLLLYVRSDSTVTVVCIWEGRSASKGTARRTFLETCLSLLKISRRSEVPTPPTVLHWTLLGIQQDDTSLPAPYCKLGAQLQASFQQCLSTPFASTQLDFYLGPVKKDDSTGREQGEKKTVKKRTSFSPHLHPSHTVPSH